MIKLFKIFLSLILCLSLFGCTSPAQRAVEQEEIQKIVTKAQKSKLIVLDVYHNRCSSCQIIEPVIRALENIYEENYDVVFLKHDLSNPFTTFKSLKIAKSIGIEDIYKAQRYSGIVLFIDTKSKKVIDTLIGEYNIEKYEAVIQKVLNAK